jgi:hypothetical protein
MTDKTTRPHDSKQHRYRVHLFAVVRVSFEVTANSFDQAAEKVLRDPLTHERLHALKGSDYDDSEEWQEEVTVDQLDERGELLVANDSCVTETVNVKDIDPSLPVA